MIKSTNKSNRIVGIELFKKGNQLIRQGNYEDASLYYESALKLLPADVTIRNNLAVCLQHKKELPKALLILRELDKEDRGNPMVLHNLGNVYFDMGKPDISIGYYYQVLAIKPSSYKAYFGIGKSHLELHCFRDAIENFEKVKELEPTYINAYLNLAICKSQIDDFAGAVREFTHARKLDSKNYRAIIGLGISYLCLSAQQKTLRFLPTIFYQLWCSLFVSPFDSEAIRLFFLSLELLLMYPLLFILPRKKRSQ